MKVPTPASHKQEQLLSDIILSSVNKNIVCWANFGDVMGTYWSESLSQADFLGQAPGWLG